MGSEGAFVTAEPVRAARAQSAVRAAWAVVVRSRVELALAVAIALATWRLEPTLMGEGPDTAWKSALGIGLVRGFEFGPDLLFVYGPLGFLVGPVFSDPTLGALALAFHGLMFVALVFVTIRALREYVSLPATAAITFLVSLLVISRVVVGPPTLPLMMLAAIWAIRAVATDRSASPAAPVALGIFSGLAMLIKFDAIAIGAFAVVAVTAIAYGAGGRRLAARQALVLVASAIGAVVFAWIALGQSIGNLPEWFRGSLEFTRGFSDSNGLEQGLQRFQREQYLLFPGFTALTFVLVARSALGVRRRMALALLLAIILFVAWKSSYVRHNDDHMLFFLGIAVAVAIALLPVVGRRWGFVLLGVSIAMFAFVYRGSLLESVGPRQTVERLLDSAKALVAPGERDDLVEQGRARVRAALDAPDELVSLMRGHSVHVETFHTQVAFVYPGVGWQPLPVFHSNVAHTAYLDGVNVDFLRSDRRPQMLLRREFPYDGRLPQFESPGAIVEMLCRYRQVYFDPDWELLQSDRNRCERARPAGRAAARMDETVPIPSTRGDAVVVARFHGLMDGPVNRVRSLAYKAPEFYVGAESGGSRYRFVPGTEDALHVVRVPECLPRNRYVQFEELTMSASYPTPGDDDAYDVEFLTIPYAC